MTNRKETNRVSACALLSVTLMIVGLASLSAAENPAPHWVATWSTSNVPGEDKDLFSNVTIRNVIHTTIGGTAVRLRLDNTFGDRSIRFETVFVGLQKDGAALVAGSNHAVTFGHSLSISIPAGAEVLSDPISLHVGAGQNVAISLFAAGTTGPATMHGGAYQTNFVSAVGNFAADENPGAFKKTTSSWYFMSAVDVLAPRSRGAIVALGDSITDGASSRPDKYERWTDVLARRLLASHVESSVLNAGIGGNRVLTNSPCWGVNALARLGRDVLSQTGAQTVILFEGTNDIGQPDTPVPPEGNPCMSRTPISANDLIAGYKQIVARVHARGMKIFGATILPYQGFAGWTPEGEAKRVAANHWIRNSGAFDGVIDFDSALRDPANPARMKPDYDSGDHLHPGTAGHKAMGYAIDLALFK